MSKDAWQRSKKRPKGPTEAQRSVPRRREGFGGRGPTEAFCRRRGTTLFLGCAPLAVGWGRRVFTGFENCLCASILAVSIGPTWPDRHGPKSACSFRAWQKSKMEASSGYAGFRSFPLSFCIFATTPWTSTYLHIWYLFQLCISSLKSKVSPDYWRHLLEKGMPVALNTCDFAWEPMLKPGDCAPVTWFQFSVLAVSSQNVGCFLVMSRW